MLTLSTVNTYTGLTTVTAGTLRFGDGVADGSIAGPLVAYDTSVIFNTTGSATMSGALDGYGSVTNLTKTGAGTQIFTGSTNSYFGTLQINAGTYQIGNGTVNGSFGSSCLYEIAAGAQLRLNYGLAASPVWGRVSGAGVLALASTPSFDWGNVSLPAEFTGTLRAEKGRVGFNGITSSGGASKIQILSGAQLLAFESATPYPTPIEIAGGGWGEGGYPGGLRLAADRTATWAGNVTLTADSGIMTQRNSNFTVAGTITGPFQCEFYAGDPVADSGMLNVAPTAAVQNSYGSTRINGRPSASVVAGNPYAFSSGPLQVVSSILKLNGNSFSFANLNGTGGTIGNYHAATPTVLTVGSDNSSTAYSGVITNGGAAPLSLVKTGTGTLSLSGANTYTGNTTINQGALSVTTPYLGDSSTVTIASGAVIDLATGASDTVGTLVLGGVTMLSGTYNSSHPTYGSYFTGTGSLVVPGGYSNWATAKGLDGSNNGLLQDPDKDGTNNLMEFYLDGNPLASDPSILPANSLGATYLTLTFNRRDDAETDLASQVVQYGSDLAGWTSAPIGATASGPDANGVIVTVAENSTAPDTITVQIPRALAPDGKLFCRLKISK
jgi:autotransporter-associated beta strand protein